MIKKISIIDLMNIETIQNNGDIAINISHIYTLLQEKGLLRKLKHNEVRLLLKEHNRKSLTLKRA